MLNVKLELDFDINIKLELSLDIQRYTGTEP